MVEALLAITIFLIVACVLLYFYKKEIRQTDSHDYQLDRIENIVNSRDNLLKDIVEKQSKIVTDTLSQSLKHIQALEKQVITKPDRVTEYVTATAPASPVENDIEKTDEELGVDAFNKAFNEIPITGDTKVKIEGDLSQLPEEII